MAPKDFDPQTLAVIPLIILVVPTSGAFDDLGRHVLVTWDGSRESARAVRDAIPLLRAAERVSLL
jgi:hypothetical protein